MTESDFNILISKHKKLLPLSFTDLTISKIDKPMFSSRITSSLKYKDKSYRIYKFNKSITRF